MVEYGRRSLGDRLRFTPEGPRELLDGDLRADGQVKVVANPPSVRVQATASFPPLVQAERHQRLLAQLDARAGSQRGKPRCSDPTRNPLGGLVFDMACGWPLYRQPYQSSSRYLCGLYQQSHGAQCKHNHVDGMLATRFVLGCVRQRLLAPSLRARSPGQSEAALSSKRAALASVRHKRERAGENLALAEGPEQYRAVAAVFEQLRQQEQALAVEVHGLEQLLGQQGDADAEVAAALAVLDGLGEQASVRADLGSIGQLFHQLSARLFLRFVEVRKKKRTVNEIAGGVVTFGETPAPVELYAGPTGRRHVQGPATAVEVAGPNSPELSPLPSMSLGGEDNSLGNVHRGEPLCTFVDEIIGLPLALSLFPQVYDFQGEAVLVLVERGLYRKGYRVRCDADNKPKGRR